MSFRNDKLIFSCFSLSVATAFGWTENKLLTRTIFSSIVGTLDFLNLVVTSIFCRRSSWEIAWLIHIDCLLYANISINDTPRTLWNNFGNVYTANGITFVVGTNRRIINFSRNLSHFFLRLVHDLPIFIHRHIHIRITPLLCFEAVVIIMALRKAYIFQMRPSFQEPKCSKKEFVQKHKRSSDKWENIEIKGSF